MNFGGIYPECSMRDALFVVVPVPYDLTSTYQPGSRRKPAAIIEASTNV
jgi:agmatinase